MAIRPRCDKCGEELKEFGGILFSPPDAKQNVRKRHLCRTCYKAITITFGSPKR